MTVIFDPTKPTEHSRFKALDIRNNFDALSRANDLRPCQSTPADTRVVVQAGRFLISTSSAVDYAGGISDSLDMSSGYDPYTPANDHRVAILHIDSAAALSWKYGAWSPDPGVTPGFDGSKIAICEVHWTYGDTVITDSMIRDVRPLLNLGAGDTVVNPNEIQIVSQDMGGGVQQDFDTSAAFLYTPGEHEILVWIDGTFLQSSGAVFDGTKDYWEYNDHIVRLNVAIVPGRKVTIWRVGLAAPSYSMRDLSDVQVADTADGGDRGTALIDRASGDVPSASNPYQTLYSHSFIDHSAITPINTILSDIVTIREHTENTGTPPFHAADGISVDPSGLSYTVATDVQGVFGDIQTAFYVPFLVEHTLLGAHGPKVTITQTNADNALNIVKTGTGGGFDLVNIGNSSPVTAIDINQNAAIPGSGAVVNIDHAATAGRGIRIGLTDVTNADTALLVDRSGPGFGIHVLLKGSANAQALYIEKQNSGNTDCVDIINSGSGVGLRVDQSGPGIGAAVFITQRKAERGIQIDKTLNGSTGDCIQIANSGSGAGIAIYQKSAGSSSGAVWISNAGTGKDITGNSGNWWFDKNGNSSQIGSASIGNNLTVNESTYLGGSGGYFRKGVGPDLYVNENGGGVNWIVCTHPVHRVNCHGVGLRYIYWGSYGNYPPVGTVVYLTGTTSQNLYPRTDGPGSNQTRNENYAWTRILIYMWMGDYWRDCCPEAP